MSIASISHIWLHPEDYSRFREICVDGGEMDETYEAWRDRVENVINELASRGLLVEKVLIDPDEFLDWCKQNGHQPDSRARSNYPAHLTRGAAQR